MTLRTRLTLALVAVPTLFTLVDCSSPSESGKFATDSDPEALSGFHAGVYTIADARAFAIDGGFFHWSGTKGEELYALTPSNAYQQWTFTASGSGFTICNVADGSTVCLSDGGAALDIGVASDVFTVAASGAGYTLQDQKTQRFVTDAVSPGDGAAVRTSTTATVWSLASTGGNTGGADAGTADGGMTITPDSGAPDGGGTPPTGCSGSLAGLTVSPSTLSFGSSTIGEETTTSLLTVSNGGGSAIAISAVGLGGANASDFREQSDCPASLAAGDKCYVRVDFKPTTSGSRSASAAINGSCSSSLTGTGISLTTAFYISPSGSDSAGNGSLSSPWQSLGKAQKAMQAGSIKTTYLRAGVYSPGGSGLQLGASDDNETWSFYPPDGVDSAIIDGGSTRSGTGVDVLIGVGGTSRVTIDGLTVRNFDGWGIGGYNASNLTVKNSVVYNGFSTAQYGAQGIACGNDCVSWSLLNNVMHDITGGGANVVAAQTGNISHLIYSGNVVYDTCTSPDDGGDCGALYTQDNLGQSTDITISGNFVRDGNPWRGHNAGSGIYLDDCLSNATVSGNVLTGTNGANTTFIHGGSNDVYVGNIIDLGPYDQAISVLQTSASNTCSNKMTGNKYVQNIILGTKGGGGWGALSWPLPALPTVEDNVFFGYGGPALSTNWDTKPVVADPELSGCFDLSAASPAYQAPVDFPALLKNWGPPGYQLPSGATAPPSYASPTCQ